MKRMEVNLQNQSPNFHLHLSKRVGGRHHLASTEEIKRRAAKSQNQDSNARLHLYKRVRAEASAEEMGKRAVKSQSQNQNQSPNSHLHQYKRVGGEPHLASTDEMERRAVRSQIQSPNAHLHLCQRLGGKYQKLLLRQEPKKGRASRRERLQLSTCNQILNHKCF